MTAWIPYALTLLPYVSIVIDMASSPTNHTIIHHTWAEESAVHTIVCFASTEHCGQVIAPCQVVHDDRVMVDRAAIDTYWRLSPTVIPWAPCVFNDGTWTDRAVVILILTLMWVLGWLMMAVIEKQWLSYMTTRPP